MTFPCDAPVSLQAETSKLPPAGATHRLLGTKSWYMGEPGGVWFVWDELLLRWREVILGSSHKALLRLIKDERATWSGEGLPPVGTVCEFTGHSEGSDTHPCLKVGDQVTIIAHFKDGEMELAAFLFDPSKVDKDLGTKQVEQGAYGCFRPIRTPEQIAAEEREKAIEHLAYEISGYNGFDDPRDVDIRLAEHLHDQKYIKQPDA